MMGKRTETTMEILYSGEFEYNMPSISSKISVNRCNIDIVKFDNNVCCVIIAEIKDKKNMSVTNVCDRVATQVYGKFLSPVPADKIVWLEYSPSNRSRKAHVDLIQFQHGILPAGQVPLIGAGKKNYVFSQPRWKRFIERRRINSKDFLNAYGHILKEFRNANLIFSTEDKSNYRWCVWAVPDGFFIVSDNPSAPIPECMLDAHEVSQTLKSNQRLFSSNADMGEKFTEALVKGFLYKGL